jgi:hypothetical protein
MTMAQIYISLFAGFVFWSVLICMANLLWEKNTIPWLTDSGWYKQAGWFWAGIVRVLHGWLQGTMLCFWRPKVSGQLYFYSWYTCIDRLDTCSLFDWLVSQPAVLFSDIKSALATWQIFLSQQINTRHQPAEQAVGAAWFAHLWFCTI